MLATDRRLAKQGGDLEPWVQGAPPCSEKRTGAFAPVLLRYNAGDGTFTIIPLFTRDPGDLQLNVQHPNILFFQN